MVLFFAWLVSLAECIFGNLDLKVFITPGAGPSIAHHALSMLSLQITEVIRVNTEFKGEI